MSTKCRTCDKVCAYRTEDYVPEYAALLARHNALVEAVRPVVEWWLVFKIEFPGHLDGVVDDKLEALAALVGEEGK